MWGTFWGKNFWSGLFWGPLASITPPVVETSAPGGSWPQPKKKKKKTDRTIPSFVPEGPRPAETIRDIIFRQQDLADEEELILLLGMLE